MRGQIENNQIVKNNNLFREFGPRFRATSWENADASVETINVATSSKNQKQKKSLLIIS